MALDLPGFATPLLLTEGRFIGIGIIIGGARG
jgi:hypothetical protein